MNALEKDVPYNPVQIVPICPVGRNPDLPEFFYHLEEDEDPLPSFAMTNPYEAMITHDPSRKCVHISPDMLHSLSPIHQEEPNSNAQELTSFTPRETGKTHLEQSEFMVHYVR